MVCKLIIDILIADHNYNYHASSKRVVVTFLFWSLVGPMIITNPSSINITTNVDNITLICEAMGIPIPTISWIYNGNILNDTNVNDLSVQTIIVGLGIVRSVLIVTSTQLNHTGEYMCNATSQVAYYNSVLSDIATVVVHGKPKYYYVSIIHSINSITII